MSVRGIKLRMDSLESAEGINAPKPRIIFVDGHDDPQAALEAACLRDDEMPIVVRFVAASESR